MTAQEAQDKKYADAGFQFDLEFETPASSSDEKRMIMNLRAFLAARIEPWAHYFLGNDHTDEFMVKFDRCVRAEVIEQFYETYSKERELAQETVRKMKCWAFFYHHKNASIQDGAETREDPGYLADGETVNPNATRFYFKYPRYYPR